MIHDIDDVVRTLRGIRGLLLYLAEHPDTELHAEFLTDMYVLMTDTMDSVLTVLESNEWERREKVS